MKRFLSKVFSPTIIAAVFFIVHVGFLCVVVLRFNEWFSWFSGACSVLSACVVIHIVWKEGNPESKIAWLIPVLFMPIFGTLLYLAFGCNRFFPKEKQGMYRVVKQYVDAMNALPNGMEALKAEYPEAVAPAAYLTNAAHVPPYQNTEVRFLPVGEAMHEALLAALSTAEKFIFFEFFIIREGEMWSSIREILVKKAQAGVDVRVMVDSMGSAFTLPPHDLDLLRKEGVKCAEYSPFVPMLLARFNNRNHRKICVVDGNIGFTGGINIGDQYINVTHPYGHWLDNAVELRGDAVYSLSIMFLSIWDYVVKQDEDYLAFRPDPEKRPAQPSGYVQPFSDSPFDNEPIGKNVYRNMIQRANTYLYITTPYLIIDEALTSALVTAAKGGVDVRIMTPALADGTVVQAMTRSYYPSLVYGGVRVFEYTPGIVHSKTMICDDLYCVVGTINLDYRSLYLHHECAAYMTGCDCILEIKEDFLKNLEKCREISDEECRNVPLMKRFFRAALRLVAPLM